MVRSDILCGDCIAELKKLPDESIHCCVTSPPYYGLRDYGFEGQIGLEKTPEEYVTQLVEVFREVRRVLRSDGVLFLNLGDSYASGKGTCYNPGGGESSLGKVRKDAGAHPLDRGNVSDLREQGLKPKDLIGIPWRVAFALQADGWYLRSDIIWHKPNTMPESVTDRCTKAHEYVFMFAKSGSPTFWTHRDHEGSQTPPDPDYRWINNLTDEETDIEPLDWRTVTYLAENGEPARLWRRINLWRGHDYFYDAEAVKEPTSPGRDYTKENRPIGGRKHRVENGDINSRGGTGQYDREWSKGDYGWAGNMRNRRDVWTIATRPYKGAHFATMPPDLAEICIKAGTSERGCCPVCGSPWVRVVEKNEPTLSPSGGKTQDYISNGLMSSAKRRSNFGCPGWRKAEPAISKTIGFRPSCDCGADPVPCIVLDPFAGSGTTGAVAKSLGRDYILIEANPDYHDLINERLASVEAPPITLDKFARGEGI